MTVTLKIVLFWVTFIIMLPCTYGQNPNKIEEIDRLVKVIASMKETTEGIPTNNFSFPAKKRGPGSSAVTVNVDVKKNELSRAEYEFEMDSYYFIETFYYKSNKLIFAKVIVQSVSRKIGSTMYYFDNEQVIKIVGSNQYSNAPEILKDATDYLHAFNTKILQQLKKGGMLKYASSN